MDTFVRKFIRASVLWLVAGVVLGVVMTWLPGGMVYYRAAHMHANLLGFVSMMIFGVAYHVIPRFAGRPLHVRALAEGAPRVRSGRRCRTEIWSPS
jgi:cbb3-type cytochrome oxidase subunit 1